MFFDNAFDTAIALLLIISLYLIYTISLSDVEDKIKEFSILRILGLPKKSLVVILIFKGFTYGKSFT